MAKKETSVSAEKLKSLDKSFSVNRLDNKKNSLKKNLTASDERLFLSYEIIIEKKRLKLENSFSKLYELGPYNILGRGYSIVRKNDTKKILRSVKTDVKKDDELEIVLSDGRLLCRVNQIYKD